MARVFIGLGSNVGDRLQFLQSALDAAGRLRSTKVVSVSPVYETEPVGEKDQSDFYNAAAELSTTLGAFELFSGLKGIEQSLGRAKTRRWGPRKIDIDILYYSTQVVDTSELSIPHPELPERRFVLVPLSDIADDFRDPTTNQTVQQLLAQCVDTCAVKKTESKLTIPS